MLIVCVFDGGVVGGGDLANCLSRGGGIEVDVLIVPRLSQTRLGFNEVVLNGRTQHRTAADL